MPCRMEAPWLLNCSKHVGRHSSLVFHGKRSHQGCFCRPVPKGLAGLHLCLLRGVLYRLGFAFLVCQKVVGTAWRSTTKVFQQFWKDWPAWVDVPNSAISGPKLAAFCCIYLGMDWFGIPLVFTVTLIQHVWNPMIIKSFKPSYHFQVNASFLFVVYSLMYCKCVNPWGFWTFIIYC